jgi:DNA-3-methyladenine glycosylase
MGHRSAARGKIGMVVNESHSTTRVKVPARADCDGDPRFTGFNVDPITLAHRLLGQRLVRVLDGKRLAGLIVEAEAYLGAEDRAAHTWNGRRTPRNRSMYLGGGHAYVYFTYGMHYCFNVVSGPLDSGKAVLIRALHPVQGIDEMHRRRIGARREIDLCSGPAKLTQALAIDRSLDSIDLRRSDVLMIEQVRRRALPASRVIAAPRIGVGYAGQWAHAPLRFFLRDSPHVSA